MQTPTLETTGNEKDLELLIPEVQEEARRRRRRLKLRSVVVVILTAAVVAAVVVIASLVVGNHSPGGPPASLANIRGAVPVDLSRGLPGAMKSAQLVSCPGRSCVLVGSGTGLTETDLVARLFESGQWNALPTPIGLRSVQLQGLSCSTTSNCVLTGYYLTPKGLTRGFAEDLGNGRWTMTQLPMPRSTSSSLDAVSCVSSTWCMAMGTDWTGVANQVFATIWNGTSWRLVPVPLPSGAVDGARCALGCAQAQATGVSCVSTSWCMAVGFYSTHSTHSTTGPLVERWSAGRWRPATAPTIVHAARSARTSEGTELRLGSVSCVSSTWCAVTGVNSVACALESTDRRAELAILSGGSWSTVLGASWRLTESGPHSASWAPNPSVGPLETGLGSVSCVTSVRCATYVIPDRFFGPPADGPLTLFEHDARGWHAVTTATVHNVELTASDVSCMRRGICLVVGTNMARTTDSTVASGAFVYGAGSR